MTLDTFLARLYSPIERTFGIVLLGASTVSGIEQAAHGGAGGTAGTVSSEQRVFPRTWTCSR